MYRRVGLGDDNSAGAAALASPPNIALMTPPTSNPNADLSWCEWCAANPFLSAFQPKCYALNESICSPIVTAYLAGAAPAMPPSQDVINSQSPDATINQILQASQANAVAAATAAAANQGSYLSPTCDPLGGSYNPILCWIYDNKGTLEVAGLALLAIWVLKGRL